MKHASADKSKPSVAIVSPIAGSTVAGTITVSVSALDNRSVAKVELRVNGSLVGTDTSSPYTFSFDTTTVADGTITIDAKAYDPSNNVSAISQINTVQNLVVIPPVAANDLSLTSSDASTVLVYPADRNNNGDGALSGTPLVRSYLTVQRVWLSAALRSGDNYFSKWQKGGVDYDTASTTSVVVDADYAMEAIYLAPPAASGIQVDPGVDSLYNAMVANPSSLTFYLKAGVHRFVAHNIGPRTGQTINGAAGAIMSGSKVLTSFTTSWGHWIATGQTQQETQTLPGRPEMVYRDNVRLTPVASLAALVTGTFYFDYVADTIHLFDDPSGHVIEATTGMGGLVGYGGGNTNVTIRNLIIEKFGGGYIAGEANDCLKIEATWLLEACEIRFISYVGVKNYGATTRNCYIHDCVQLGIAGGPGLIEGNVISNNNTGHFDIWNDSGGSKFLHTFNMTLRGNLVIDNYGNALWSDFDNKTVTYENNRIERNTGMGINNEVNCGAVMRYNFLRDNNSAGWIANNNLWNGGQIGNRSSGNVEIYGNEIVANANQHGLGVRADPAQTYTSGQCGTIYAHDVLVHDNVFRLGSNSLVGTIGAGSGYSAANNLLFQNNTYYVASLVASHWEKDGLLMNWTTWQAAGQDTTGSLLLS